MTDDDNHWAKTVESFCPDGMVPEHFILFVKMLDPEDGQPLYTYHNDGGIEFDTMLGMIEGGKFAIMRDMKWEEHDDAEG